MEYEIFVFVELKITDYKVYIKKKHHLFVERRSLFVELKMFVFVELKITHYKGYIKKCIAYLWKKSLYLWN